MCDTANTLNKQQYQGISRKYISNTPSALAIPQKSGNNTGINSSCETTILSHGTKEVSLHCFLYVVYYEIVYIN